MTAVETVNIAAKPAPGCKTEVRITAEPRNPDPADTVAVLFADTATLGIRTGASYLQTYMTREECVDLAEALYRVAAAMKAEEVAAKAKPEPEPIPVAEAVESGFGDLDGAEYPAWTVPGREFT